MKLQRGDMWTVFDAADLFLITTNATIKANGALVMGRGIAQQARDRFPGLDLALGRTIQDTRRPYGLLTFESSTSVFQKIGAFQVKDRYYWPAEPALIAYSAGLLMLWCEKHPTAHVHLNYPGIGNGKLQQEQVAPIVEQLPDNVTLWIYEKASAQ